MSASYNGAQELTSYNDTAADMKIACYDGDGLRQALSTTSTDRLRHPHKHLHLGRSGSLPRLLMDSTNAYIYGPGDTPSSRSTSSPAPPVSHRATCSAPSAASSAVRRILTAHTSYDAWGNPETTGGLTSYTPFGFAGGYTDPTGLIYLIDRYYDPTTGQFLTVDPLVDETGQPYAYVGDDPVDRIDPLGATYIYILFNKATGLPYYVGQTAKTVDSRLAAHAYIGRYDPDQDFVRSFDLGNASAETTDQVEQAVMSELGTVQPSDPSFNQRNEFQAGSAAQESAVQVWPRGVG